MDNIHLHFRGNNLNLFQKYVKLRNTAFWAAMVCLAAWVVFGFDSTPLQFIHVIYDGFPGMIQGGFSLQDLTAIYNSYYGKEMHYSAFVIYFLLYAALSRSWEKAGVSKSKNVVFSSAGVFLAISVFEWFWILGFSTFQYQPWVSTWRMPQLRILLQNTVFLVAAGFTLLYMLTDRWHWNGRIQGDRAFFFMAKSWKLWVCVGLSVAAAFFWIYYPGQIQQISVELADGSVWRSSRLFPQTLYTVDLDPGDAVNAGVWFYMENDLIHLTNTFVKAVWALTTFMLLRVKPVEK